MKPEERLGSNGADDIRAHPWFEGLDWAALEARSVPAPITPELSSPVDASNFDDFADPPATPRFPPGQVLGGRTTCLMCSVSIFPVTRHNSCVLLDRSSAYKPSS